MAPSQLTVVQRQLKEHEEFAQQQLREQAERMTLHNNRRIEELMAKQRLALQKEQKEREKLAKKVAKEKMKTDKVRERCGRT